MFVPFASVIAGWSDFAAKVQNAIAATGITLAPIDAEDDPAGTITAAEMIFVGGGNTFNLLAECGGVA